MSKKSNREIRPPDWEKPIQPIINTEIKGGKIKKRPDFTCNLCNTITESPDNYVLPFHVECKRLGKPTSPAWILNKNYVENGIKRFDSSEHEYGKRANSGLMIGYKT